MIGHRGSSILSVLLCLVLFGGFPPVACPGTLVELKSGERLPQAFEVGTGPVRLADGREVPRDQVRQILYGVGGMAASPAAGPAADVQEVLRLASEAAAFEARHPDAGGLVLLDDMDYRYRPDGTWVLRSRGVYKVMKEDHKSLADQAMAFTEGRERAHILVARCIRPDGEVFAANLEEVKITKPQMSPGMFLNYHYATVRIPGVEIGSLVEVVMETETYNPYHREFFFPVSYFQTRDPVFRSRLAITTPADKPLFWETRNFPPDRARPVETEKDGARTWTWELNEVPPLVEEPLMPRGADAMPYVQASLFEGWDKVYDWINVYWKANTTPSPELASQARRLVEGAATEDEKVARLYHWIQKNIRYIIIKGDAATLYGSYPAHETAARQFGCCVDKAMVFSAMLNAVGIPNGPLLINAGSHEMSPRIPNLGITHSISRITRADGRKYYLDATGYDYRYPAFGSFNQGRACLDPFDRSYDIIPMQAPEENQRRIVSTMTLDLDMSLSVQTERFFSGDREAGTRGYLKSLKPAEREKFWQSRVNSFGKGAVLDSWEIRNLEEVEKPMTVSLTYRLPAYARQIADLAILSVPGFLEAIEFPELAIASRSYPIEYESTESHFDEGTITIPEGWQVRSLPEPLEIKSEFLSFSGAFTAAGGRAIAYRGRFDRLAKRVPLAALAAFRADVQRVERFKKDRIFLVRQEPGKKGE